MDKVLTFKQGRVPLLISMPHAGLKLTPAVKIIEASSGRLPLDVLIGLGAGSEEHIDGRHSHHDHHHEGEDDHDHDAFDSISIDLPQADEALLLDALTQLVVQHGILRVKGFAAIPNKPMRLLIQGVGTRFDKHFDRAVGAYMADNSMIDIIQQGATLAIDSGRTQIVDGEIYAVEHDGMQRSN